MAEIDEFDLNDVDENINKTNKVEERIKDLSSKVKNASDERDALATAKAETEAQLAAANKERDFFKGFSTATTKYPGAAEFQDTIREKVMAGYDIEDATVAVLAKEGKFNPPAPVVESAIGGSATNQLGATGTKSISEMNQAERREKLMEAEKRGDITV